MLRDELKKLREEHDVLKQANKGLISEQDKIKAERDKVGCKGRTGVAMLVAFGPC